MKNATAHAFVNHLLVYALVASGSCGSLGLGMVWMREQISIAANNNKVLELRLAEVERRIDETTATIASEQDADTLIQRNSQWHLGLVPPTTDQVQRVTEDPEMRLAAKHNGSLLSDAPESVQFRVASLP